MILENEIKIKMLNIDHEVIIKKIERAHRTKENKPGRNLPVITKLNNWNFLKKAETSFTKAEKAGNERNKTMKIRP